MKAILNSPQLVTGSNGDMELWPFVVCPCTPAIGAFIDGIDLGKPLADETYLALRLALLKFKVLFFHDQDITPAQHVALGRRFGELEIHPKTSTQHHPEHPELLVLDRHDKYRGLENLFHSDTSWRATPAMGSILRCVTCPDVGGDTIWVNTAAVYAALPDAVKQRIANLEAVHDAMPAFGRTLNPENYAVMRKELPPMVHPVVRTHPETAEKILFVNEGFTTHLANYGKETLLEYQIGADFRPAEMDLLRYLYQRIAAPEYQVRLRWQANTIAFWDNRSTQHYAVQDYFPARRVMHRATIIGDRPL